jgi:hypothetical protein
MKHLTMIKYAAVTGLVAGSLNAAAAGFGGGWMQDPNTGTLYYSHASDGRLHAASDAGHSKGHQNSFGGGWVQDRHTNTLSYSRAPEVGQWHADSEKVQLNSFGGDWVHDRNTGTLSYSPAADSESHKIAALKM